MRRFLRGKESRKLNFPERLFLYSLFFDKSPSFHFLSEIFAPSCSLYSKATGGERDWVTTENETSRGDKV